MKNRAFFHISGVHAHSHNRDLSARVLRSYHVLGLEVVPPASWAGN